MQNIRNIIFDFGGVFIDIDYQLTAKAFKDLGVANFDELYSQHKASPLFEELETGRANEASFYNLFRELTGHPLHDEQIKTAWNAMIGGYSKEKLQWLENLRSKYKIYLFSNTNEIHYNAFTALYKQTVGDKPFDDYFDAVYYSHTAGFRKPGKEAFIQLLQTENLKAAETLFVDDTEVNCIGAKGAGLAVIHLKPPMTVFDLQL
jgi:glucose-1-phosphatase